MLVQIFYIIKIIISYNLKTFGNAFAHSDINTELSSTACWNASFLDQRFENDISMETAVWHLSSSCGFKRGLIWMLLHLLTIQIFTLKKLFLFTLLVMMLTSVPTQRSQGLISTLSECSLLHSAHQLSLHYWSRYWLELLVLTRAFVLYCWGT